jgi:tetraacyldisaccharide 4'-kinase
MSRFANVLMCWLLAPFSWLYGLGIRCRNIWYDRRTASLFKADVPVISVGNISTGGTGKTPFSEYLLRFFEDQGLRPAYLSRGYGRASKGYRLVDSQATQASEFGDEALQVARKFARLPVAVCESRAEGIRRLQRDHAPDLIVLDDAFQHRKVRRDADILLFDAHRLPQQDCLLPAGRLREPKSSIRRADFLVVNKLEQPSDISNIEKQFSHWQKPMAFCQPVFDGIFDFETDTKSEWQAAKHTLGAVLFSGLGNNDYFHHQITSCGIQVLQAFAFPDHHRYTEQDLQEIMDAFRQHTKNSPKFDSLLILTTEKDRSRLRGSTLTHPWHQMPLCYIPIRLAFSQGQEALEARLLSLVDSQK